MTLGVRTRIEGKSFEILTRMPRLAAYCDYVFLTPLNATCKDVLLYRRVVHVSGFLQFPAEGSVLRCVVIDSERGPRAVRILSVESPRVNGNIPSTALMGPELMTVKFFNQARGFGFFTRDDGADVFVHVAALGRSGMMASALKPGSRFKVAYKLGDKGLQVTTIIT